MRVKALLIDFDGVLVDSTKAYMKATDAAMRSSNHLGGVEEEAREMSLEIARRFELGFSEDKLLDGLVSLASDTITDFLDVWLRAWNEACLREVEPAPGVYKVLKDLSGRFPLALVTLRHIESLLIEEQLERLELDEFFKAIITRLDVKRPKPHPDSFLEGAKRLGVPIEDCAVVGDSVVDIRAGKAAGARTIAVSTGLFDEKTLKRERPDLIIRSITELPPHLE